jgi:hypothetical protein
MAGGPRAIGAQEAREARGEDGLAVQRPAAAGGERRVPIQQPRGVSGGAGNAGGVEVVLRERGLGGEQRGRLAHIPGHRGADQLGGGPAVSR